MIRPEDFTERERHFVSQVRIGLDGAARATFLEPEQRLLVSMMRLVRMTRYPPVMGEPGGERAGGECECSVCGQAFRDHPFDWRVIGYGDVPFLNVLCDGRRVKL